ncbi:MAG: macro domain-containing protein [Cyanosarcina radialis HA8281-LM2]|jgi:O-acetyl-ADP-ribose deacetylase (regulator of RNase III)|nr:macro domain-containing protein [Cyanosarcina radialis HA8281-LM2]
MLSASIQYLIGDATNPIGEGKKLIVHICNGVGTWGAGFVLALSKKWQEPEREYRAWYKSGNDFALGKTQFVRVEDNIFVANLIGQSGIRRQKSGSPPVRYAAIETGLIEVARFTNSHRASIHMPRIGCGLAGGDWQIIEKIIDRTLLAEGLSVTVYDLV